MIEVVKKTIYRFYNNQYSIQEGRWQHQKIIYINKIMLL